MSQAALTPSVSDDLQFETIESRDVNAAAVGPSRQCVGCGQPIVTNYFAVGDKIVCPACCAHINGPVAGSRLWSFVKASLMGFGAGLLGAVIWFTIRRVAHLEIGLVAILVGFMVGKAVRRGSGGRGGVGYQVLAVVITYSCIAANYMPDIVEAVIQDVREHRQVDAPDAAGHAAAKAAKKDAGAGNAKEPLATPPRTVGFGEAVVSLIVFLGLVFAMSLAAPFLAGAENAIGLLIIGIALWEAWKLSAGYRLAITGPYQLGASPNAS